jgi:hypothetical protein
MRAEVIAAAETSNRRRSMANGKSGLAMTPSRETKDWRYRYVLPCIGHIPVSGRTAVLRRPVGESARGLVLMWEIEYRLAGCGANLLGRVVSQFESLMGFSFCVRCFSSHLFIVE